MWKFLARHHSLCVSEEVLRKFFSWAKAHAFPKDVVSSLDPRVWDSLSLCLLGELRQGGRSPRQLPMWSLLSKVVRGQTPLESESTLVGTSQSGLEEHFPLGRWPSAFPPQTSGNNPFTDRHRWFLPPPHRGVGATLPTEHSKQLAPGFLAHVPEVPKPSVAPLSRSAVIPNGAAVAPAPLPSPAQEGPLPPPPRVACGLAPPLGSPTLHHRRGQSRLCHQQGGQPVP